MAVLVVAENDSTGVDGATLRAVTAALACASGEVHVLVAGTGACGAALAAARIAGVRKVIAAAGPALADGLAENLAAQVLALASGYSHILFAATARGKNVAPRVAALLDVAAISEITRVVAPDTFERQIYAGSVVATVQSCDTVKVGTVRTTSFEPAAAGAEVAPIQEVAAVADSGKSRFIGREVVASARPALAAAEVVVAGGRGLGSAAGFQEVLGPLADRLNAALGATLAAVDEGFAPNDWQVGQTGRIVAPRLYIACAISGAIQHIAGIREARVIVAINSDEEAPIFSVADYGLVADVFEAVPEWVGLMANEQEGA